MYFQCIATQPSKRCSEAYQWALEIHFVAIQLTQLKESTIGSSPNNWFEVGELKEYPSTRSWLLKNLNMKGDAWIISILPIHKQFSYYKAQIFQHHDWKCKWWSKSEEKTAYQLESVSRVPDLRCCHAQATRSQWHHFCTITLTYSEANKVWQSLQFGSQGFFQQCPHVQKCILHGLGQTCCIGFFTCVKRWHCNVDVIIHRIVAHTVSIGHNRAKTHKAVSLRWYLVRKWECYG